MKILIRNYKPTDARVLTDIFYDTVHEVAKEYYTIEELNEWAPLPKDYKLWSKRLSIKPPLVAEIEGEIAGFITLEDNGHIDLTYTHKDFQRIGVATALYKYLEEEAIKKGIRKLYVEASYLAKPFFEKKGFTIISRNKIERNGQTLINWLMEKYINLKK